VHRSQRACIEDDRRRPPIEAWVDKNEKKYHLSIALAGVDPKDVQLSVQGNNLMVSGEQKASEEKKEANYQYQEFSYGRFERAITLPRASTLKS